MIDIILKALQELVPLVEKPFLSVAPRVGLSEEELFRYLFKEDFKKGVCYPQP
ncbi:hypothetical protein [Thermocrinis minervae]|uniref:Siroheme decarboxylase NirL-like HTH domain-containing protein n=1 Tax=Thermocrinis minervae TaxID=381751 RepID=A0A1M6QNZ7_9AQUI|nr:hypothetical protein [Thermocrinis minervae]SHK21991.1 hypothetical protein SAMN05444391_0323 [Thermocrinis minervae]